MVRSLDNEMGLSRKENEYIKDAYPYIKDGNDERLEADDEDNGDFCD